MGSYKRESSYIDFPYVFNGYTGARSMLAADDGKNDKDNCIKRKREVYIDAPDKK